MSELNARKIFKVQGPRYGLGSHSWHLDMNLMYAYFILTGVGWYPGKCISWFRYSHKKRIKRLWFVCLVAFISIVTIDFPGCLWLNVRCLLVPCNSISCHPHHQFVIIVLSWGAFSTMISNNTCLSLWLFFIRNSSFVLWQTPPNTQQPLYLVPQELSAQTHTSLKWLH